MDNSRALEILDCWCATAEHAEELCKARDHIKAELLARRARDAEVEAVVDRLATDRAYSSGEAVDDLRAILTGARP